MLHLILATLSLHVSFFIAYWSHTEQFLVLYFKWQWFIIIMNLIHWPVPSLLKSRLIGHICIGLPAFLSLIDCNSKLSLECDFLTSFWHGPMRMTVKQQNCIHKEIESRLSSENVCYHTVQNLLFSCLLYKT